MGAPAVVGGREPEQVDLGGRDVIGNQPGWRIGHGRVGGGARDPRRIAHTDPVDRRDAVVARRGRREPRVRVDGGRGARIGHQVLPAPAPVGRHFDAVAGDARTPVVRGRLPGEGDLRGADRLGVETSRHPRHGRVGGRARRVRKRSHPREVDRSDPVVPRGRGPEVHVGERRRRRVRVAADDVPGRASVVGRLDAVAENRDAAGVAGRVPRQVDARRAHRLGHQPGRGIGKVGVREGHRRERPLAGAHAVDGRDLVLIPGHRVEPGVGEGRGRVPRVRPDDDPVAVVGPDHPDAVAGDGRPSVGLRRIPGEENGVRPGPARAHVLRLPRTRGVGPAPGHRRERPDAHAVDRGHAIEAGDAGREARVQVGGARGACVGSDDDPAADAGGGHLDAVAGDRAPAVVGRGRPGKKELAAPPRAARNHPEARGRARARELGGRARGARPLAGAGAVDRRDPVVAGGARPEPAVGVAGGRGGRVGMEHRPAAGSRARPFDAVAGDCSRAARGRSTPAQLDGGRSLGRCPQRPGRARHDILRGGVGHVRRISRPVEVDRRHPVVARDAPRETIVAVARVGVPGIAFQRRPGVTPVRRHLDLVPGDFPPAVVGRSIPVQVDRVGAVGRRRQVARLPGNPGARLSRDVPHRPVEAEREVADLVPERVGGAVVVEHPNRVERVYGAGQKQEHLARRHVYPGYGLDAARAAPEEVHLEVARRWHVVLIEIFVESDGDFIAGDPRVAHYRAPGVHVDLDRRRRVPLPRSVLRHVPRDMEEHRTIIFLRHPQRDDKPPAGIGVQRIGLSTRPRQVRARDVDVVDVEPGHVLRETDDDAGGVVRGPDPRP